MQNIWNTMKRLNLQIMGIEGGKEIQTKGNENLFNRIIVENFPTLEKERVMKVTYTLLVGMQFSIATLESNMEILQRLEMP
jgi:hypothetical protein